MSEACVSSTSRSCGSAPLAEARLGAPLRLLLVTDRTEAAADLAAVLDPSWFSIAVAADGAVPDDFDGDAVLIDLVPDNPGSFERAIEAAAHLRDTPAPCLVLNGRLRREERIALYRAGAVGFVDAGDDGEELAARIASLLGTKRTASRALQRLRDHSRHLDEQLRLAQRLQMDFLPRRLPVLGTVRFAARLEPAAWVAGDFYDVFRLDEQHVGFYVADAVGHGIPAALLTVFVKKSLQTKRIHGNAYDLIGPEEALRLLNADILSAELQEAPFVTMVYGIYNEATRECTYARAGHPKPLLLGPHGDLQQLEGEGPLLGIFPNAAFSTCRRRLEPGQRLLLYTDGAERVEPGRHASPGRFFEIVRTASLLPLEALLDSILDAVRGATGGHRLADDVTLVALEVTVGEQDE
ncbi:MAG TPA: SpoIIE family protein phosphatase [Phycisphaerae bacterium]|nr:SpoIIE family protein phosphatase [Phycisphaerae bacterium]